jgi:RHH-type proline utilization regulon transcriptional repressor/proline dehydrogenase/delta 1-pyrroline-5-carboxylate dehydrogenase
MQTDLQKTIRAIKSYIYHVENEFSQQLDYFHIRGQSNILRYLPVGTVVVRLHPADSLFDVLARIAAVQITGCRLQVSIPTGLDHPAVAFLDGVEGRNLMRDSAVIKEDDPTLAARIPTVDRIRYASPDRVPQHLFQAAAETGFYVARTPVVMEGRIELLQYYRQQSICHNYHRYGNLGERAAAFDTA